MKNIFLALSFVFLSSCSLLNTIGDFIDENPVFVNFATNQVVVRYIEAVDTVDDKRSRAEDLQSRFNNVLSYIDGHTEITIDELLTVIDSSVDWSELSQADKILVSDIIMLVEIELRKFELNGPEFNAETKFTIRALLNVAVRAAGMYL